MSTPMNPFPGMNPYLEQHWADVHPSLLIYAKARLQAELPAGLKARVEQDVVIDDQGWRPDVSVWERSESPASQGGAGAAVIDYSTATKPVRVKMLPRPRRHLAIKDHRGSLVTVIEVLSYANKRGKDSDSYARKREMLMSSGINIVEIDLLRRGGLAFLLFDDGELTDKVDWANHPPPYCVSVYRDTDRDGRELYPVRLQERLPVIRIPLRMDDADVLLDLQPLIDQCHVDGGYDDINYHAEPVPPLLEEDTVWLDHYLRSKALR